MPPRLVKKGSGGSSGPQKKAVARASKVASTAEERAKVGKVVEMKPEFEAEEKTKLNGSVVAQVQEDVKEVCEEDKGERLDLEDNGPGYGPEEDAADYDENEMESYVQEDEDDRGEEDSEEGDVGDDEEADMEVGKVEEDSEEGDVGDEEEADMVEAMEDSGVDVGGEEDDENAEEEHEIDGEEEEHQELVKEHRKRKEFEVFVGGLDKDATEDDLWKVFKEVGEITEVRLMMNPQTKKNKGFAFLRFATVEQAKRAVSELKNPVVNGKQCGVAPSHDNDTLFLGNICKTWTKEHLKEKLKSYGIENIEDLTLIEDTNSEGMNRGFAFIEFSSRSEAMSAFRRLQKRDIVFGVDRSAKVAFADSFIEPNDEVMAQVKTIFIDGLPAAWDEDRVKGYLKKYGEIEKIELARNMPAAKRKDFGFVTFDTHNHAVACAEAINNSDLGEGGSKVKVRARLSRPHQRSRVKHGTRGDFRIGRTASRGGRMLYGRPAPRRLSEHGSRVTGGYGVPISGRGFKRPMGIRDRRPPMAMATRHLPPPERSYDRRPPVPAYPKNSSKRDYVRHDEPPSRSRIAATYNSRVPSERRSSYRDDYSSHGSGYSDIAPRSAPRTDERRAYVEEGYVRKLERPLPTYQEGRSKDYDTIRGSKRPYLELDDAPSRYAEATVRQSRARLDYGITGGSSQYADAYDDRLGRSHVGYGSSRSSLSGQDELYGNRAGISYGGGSINSSEVGGMYSSSYGSSYMRGSDVGGSSYSALYSGRSLNGSRYIGGGGSGSYY